MVKDIALIALGLVPLAILIFAYSQLFKGISEEQYETRLRQERELEEYRKRNK